jgi:iron complex outermembrane receptor protein
MSPPLSEGLKMGLSGDVSHTSSLLTDDASDPLGKMKAYTLLDANLRVADADDTWELAVIGRNLTNKYYWTGSNNVPFTGTPGGTDNAVLGDRDAALSRGRQVMLRVSYKFK